MRFVHVAIESLAYALPEEIVTSAEIETRLAAAYERLKLPSGRLELMTGIRERRFWPADFAPSQASARAGEAVLAKSRFDREQMDLLMHCGVCRDRLEPATAAAAHDLLKLPPSCQFFDLSNACLGFLNAMSVAAAMVESGQIQRALLVSGENGRTLLERTIACLLDPAITRSQTKPYFANLTIGAGAVGAVLSHTSLAPDAPKLSHCISLSDTSANRLCQGGVGDGGSLEMQTDAEALLEAGIDLARQTWSAFSTETGWAAESLDRVICHQVGRQHRQRLYEALGLSLEKDFSTYETLGNVGSVSCPLTLAQAVDAGAIARGSRVALLGIGSGLACLMAAVQF
ncbi:MAG: 3-oxoacyl-ACP synthase III [Opitutales bacterium]